MRDAGRKWRRFWSAALVAGWFIGFYLHVLLRVRPQLFYQQNPAVFLLDGGFFDSFMDRPGGLVEYASAFLSPLLAFNWLGALVLTSLAALIGLATRQFMAALARPAGSIVLLAPSLLILMMLGQYHHPLRVCVGLCLVLGLAAAYAKIGRGHPAVRLTAFAILSALAYWAAAGLYVLFALLCGIFEWRVLRRWWLGAAYAMAAVAVPMAAGAWLCGLSIEDSYRGLLLPTERYWLAVPSSALVSQAIRAALLLFFPMAALSAGWRRRAAGLPVVPREAQTPMERPDNASEAADGRKFGPSFAFPCAALIVLGVAADGLLFDVSTKYSLLMAYSAERQQWADVLECARRLPPSDVWNVFQVNRALYHRGELLERMFAYPQVADSVPALTLQFESLTATAQRVPLECGDVLFDLGRINESEHMAYEALELFGERPHTLQRLVHLHAIKGEPEAARRFLAVLERSLLHRGWARGLLRQMDADPTLANAPEVASRRALMVERDFTGKLELETMLTQLLERNPRNRMALEYLMAYYLLTRRIGELTAHLHRFDDLGQDRLPRHCEEAVLIYLDTAGSPAIDLGGRQIRPETRRRHVEFARAASRLQGSAAAAFAALYRDFGDSYFFFYVFGRNTLPPGQARPSR